MDALDSSSVGAEGFETFQTADAGAAQAAPRAVATQSQRWEGEYLRLVVAIDVAVAVLAGGTAYFVRFAAQGWYIPRYLALSLLLPLAWLLTLSLCQAYESRFLYVGPDEYRRVLVAVAGFTAGIAFVSYTVHLSLARGYVAIVVTLLAFGDLVGRHALRKWLHRNRCRDGRFMKRVVLVGYERAVANMCRQLSRERYHGVQVVGACLPPHRPRRQRLDDVDVDVLGTFNDVVGAVEACGADAVAVLACPELDAEVLRGLAWQLEKTGTDLFVAPALIDVAGPRTTIRPIDGLPLLHVEHPELAGARRVVKTSFDIALAALALIVLTPALIGVGIAIRLTSPGPALFRQTRVGKEGQTFSLYKFRTMYVGSEERLAEVRSLNEHDGVLFKVRHDPRVTSLGHWLRRYSVDELPQLVNVLRGDMSLVGPRPPLPSEVELYAGHVRRRLVVKPGLTGLWQVSGRADLPWEEAVRLDLRYVENWSLALDVVILARTMTAVIRSSGAY
ncbi:MAG: UDP-phosphate galactose phosphotransferase [Pseudonocardiales bacterium]|nr:MAG: UDP-phosphate galactose phosphotransferase [Pseudonocardiales bacterium]